MKGMRKRKDDYIAKAVEERNRQIANLLWNTGKLSEVEIEQITGVSPTKIDSMHGTKV